MCESWVSPVWWESQCVSHGSALRGGRERERERERVRERVNGWAPSDGESMCA